MGKGWEERGGDEGDSFFKKLANIIKDTAKSKTYNVSCPVGGTRNS
jgi:hypothetical protein